MFVYPPSRGMATFPAFNAADFQGDITLDHVIPEAAAQFAPLPAGLRPELVGALARRGIERLYSHQADAYSAIRNGRHLVVVTPTASGKTLCYNLPVLQRLLESPEKRALYLYPTKALAQDQLAELSALKHGLPIDLRVDTYDGDTPPGRRTAIREPGHAARRPAAASHKMAPSFLKPGLRGRRRAPHVPRTFRKPGRQRHPAP